jgi:serine phosphatase RsbU (regulator of sigma subunit)
MADRAENKKEEIAEDIEKGKKGKKKKPLRDTGSKKTRVRFSLKLKFSIMIITLVVAIILIMTYFIINTQTEVLKKEMIKLAKREVEHLQNTSADAISAGDDLALVALINDLKRLESIKYAYILDKDNRIKQNFDQERNNTILEDEHMKEIASYGDKVEPLSLTIPDEKEGGMIFDFSKPLYHKIFKTRIGTVRLGFSDKAIRDQIASVTKNITIIALFFIFASIFGAVILSTITIRPIKKLSEGATVIGTGNLDYKIRLKTSDEIGQLANEFNVMTEQLKKARDLEIESRIMEEQLELAKEIQEGLNPMGYYDKGGIQIKGFTRAAKGVGGDYFDYVDIDKNRVGALLSDVSGKGVPASLVMVMIRTVFVTYLNRKDIECASVVRAINDSLSADFAIDKFATLFFMIYDRSRGELHFTNAGHGPLFCYRASRDACTVTKLDDVPIGIMADVKYKQAKVRLNPGDLVVLYSDGVTEMRNEDKEEYGRLRLQSLIIENNRLNASELVDKIVSDVDVFRGNVQPHDDMTTLVLKRSS